ncbi:MAG: CCA tRNA nucleotidyltransferase [Deltaproteobacteria bacterium]|nr:CCA tRNA nucleotidyltransferase [Deltaproteobacteria bacterium]
MNISELLNQLPSRILNLLRDAGVCAEEMGFCAYAVGGIVRDLFLRRDNLDVDVVIEGDGIAFASGFSVGHNARFLTYEKFGTANLVFPDGFKLDVATARTEAYERPAALPLVVPGSIRDDMFRRDFSINTLAVNLNPDRFGELLDLFHARDDIRKRLIRVLHEKSFIDDPTRIFRAARFEKRFDFRIESITEKLIRDAVSADLIERLSGHRISSELRLILKEENPLLPVRRLDELGVLSAVGRKGEKHKELKRLLHRIDEMKLMV